MINTVRMIAIAALLSLNGMAAMQWSYEEFIALSESGNVVLDKDLDTSKIVILSNSLNGTEFDRLAVSVDKEDSRDVNFPIFEPRAGKVISLSSRFYPENLKEGDEIEFSTKDRHGLFVERYDMTTESIIKGSDNYFNYGYDGYFVSKGKHGELIWTFDNDFTLYDPNHGLAPVSGQPLPGALATFAIGGIAVGLMKVKNRKKK